jgi:arabinoxylan arabinofuranohydrolase
MLDSKWLFALALSRSHEVILTSKYFVLQTALKLSFFAALVSVMLVCEEPIAASVLDQPGSEVGWTAAHNGNPFIPGYYADASVLQTAQETFIYATEDPWGTRTLGCWRSMDFVHWKSCVLNWPTKEAARSPTANSNKVWAPSVVRGKDGRYYMYVSIGSEVWAGVSDNPLGPWRNGLGDKPLIPATFNRAYNMIDAEAFVDTDGTAYLYWGSGLHWVNGHCFAVRLKPDMMSFDGEPRDVTPPHYFEGPFMYKRGGKYYLMYSEGKATDATYKVRYSVGETPFGPFREGASSPILVSDERRDILGPGHHAVFMRSGKTYIIYHRHSLPFSAALVKRQLCVEELVFDPNGEIRKVRPTHLGPALLQEHPRSAGALPGSLTASSQLDTIHGAAAASDDNYATRWQPADNDAAPSLQMDLGSVKQLARTEVRVEFPSKVYFLQLETSLDGKAWKKTSERQAGMSGSPITLDHLPRCRYLRLSFPKGREDHVSLWEWTVF